MKSYIFFAPLLLIWNHSIAQASVPDTTKITIRRGPCIYYIDGIKVNVPTSDSLKDSTMTDEEVQIITGGLQVIYGDVKSSLIQVNSTPPVEMDRKTIRKEEKMATE